MKTPVSAVELSRIVGYNIRCARKHLNLTQDELSARTEVIGFRINRRVIGKIECAEKLISIYDLIVLSQALHLPADDILKGEWNDETSSDSRAVCQ